MHLAKPRRLLAHALQPVSRDVQQARCPGVGNRGKHDQVAQAVQQVGGKPAGIMTAFDYAVDGAEHCCPVPGGECLGDLVQQSVVGIAEQSGGAIVTQAGFVRSRNQLVQHRQRVADGSGACADHHRQHGRLVCHTLAAEYLLQQLPQDRRRNQAERIVVRAGPDGGDHLLRLRRGEDELQVRWRLLDQLEQGVEALPGHHVGLVDDVDLETARHRRVEGALAQVPRVVHPPVRGRVNLDHVDAAGPGRRQGDAGSADPAGVRSRAGFAVQRAGQDPGAGGLAAAARTAEQIGMMHPAAAQRLPQRFCDVILAFDLGESGRTIPAVERQRRGRGTWPRRVGGAGIRTGTGDVACHDLILARA